MDIHLVNRGMLTLVIFTIFLFITLAGGCIKSGSESTNSGTQKSVEYPKNWPITQLTAPPGSYAGDVPIAGLYKGDPRWKNGIPFNPGTESSGKGWELAFRSNLDWPVIISHFDEQLRPLGYMLCRRIINPAPNQMQETIYANSECTQTIRIYYYADIYRIQINMYDRPQGKENTVFSDMQAIP